MERLVQSEEAARRPGVKVATLYAYVSRGLLESHPGPHGRRRRLFDLADIERLARRHRSGGEVESRLATVATGVTHLRPDGPAYRGRPATELAAALSFEEVAALLWQADAAGDWSAPALPPCPLTPTYDRLRWTLVMCGAGDPLRADARPEALARAARRVIAALVRAVGPDTGPDPEPDGTGSIAERLARRLTGSGSSLSAAAMNSALILMADHEVATSTLAVRVAASVRADLYDALLAGLATMAGPLHGGASQQVYELLVAAERDGASRALNDALRLHRHLPGFGHMVYTGGDPRYAALLPLVEPLLSEERRDLLHQIVELSEAHAMGRGNCDLALAALSWGTGMPTDAGRTIFTVARVAGWTAHYQEELAERPLRFRARAVYSA